MLLRPAVLPTEVGRRRPLGQQTLWHWMQETFQEARR